MPLRFCYLHSSSEAQRKARIVLQFTIDRRWDSVIYTAAATNSARSIVIYIGSATRCHQKCLSLAKVREPRDSAHREWQPEGEPERPAPTRHRRTVFYEETVSFQLRRLNWPCPDARCQHCSVPEEAELAVSRTIEFLKLQKRPLLSENTNGILTQPSAQVQQPNRAEHRISPTFEILGSNLAFKLNRRWSNSFNNNIH